MEANVLNFDAGLKLKKAESVAMIDGVIATKKITITHANLLAADTEQIMHLFDLPTGSYITDLIPYVATAFTGGSVSAITVEIGTSTKPYELMQATSIFTARGVLAAARIKPCWTDVANRYSASIQAKFKAVGDNLVNLTAGSMDIVICYAVCL